MCPCTWHVHVYHDKNFTKAFSHILYWATVILSLGLRICRPNFSELMKTILMIFLTCVVYFSGNFMSNCKGFSIYNETVKTCNKIVLVKTFQWLRVRACDKHGSFFKVRLKFGVILIFILSPPNGYFGYKKSINLKIL